MSDETHPERTHLCRATAVSFWHQQVRGPLVLSISPIEPRNQRRKHLLPRNPSGWQNEIHFLDTMISRRVRQARACEMTQALAVYLFLNSLTKFEKDGPRLTACVLPPPLTTMSVRVGLSASGAAAANSD